MRKAIDGASAENSVFSKNTNLLEQVVGHWLKHLKPSDELLLRVVDWPMQIWIPGKPHNVT